MFKFLIAEDHAAVRQRMKQMIQEEFGEVVITEAKDTFELLQQASLQPWDMIISDINMPGAGGLEALEQIHRQHPATPVIIVSVNEETLYAQKAMQLGAVAYIQKDKLNERLLNVIRQWLQTR